MACLDVLPNLVAKMETELKSVLHAKYQISEFGLAVQLPSALLVRQAAILEFLKRELNLSLQYGDIKDIVKNLAEVKIGDGLQVPYGVHSEFVVTLNIEHEETSGEWEQIIVENVSWI